MISDNLHFFGPAETVSCKDHSKGQGEGQRGEEGLPKQWNHLMLGVICLMMYCL